MIAESEEGGYHEGPIPGGPGQLYDMIFDPYETTNLYSEKPELVVKMKASINKYILQGYTRPMNDGARGESIQRISSVSRYLSCFNR